MSKHEGRKVAGQVCGGKVIACALGTASAALISLLPSVALATDWCQFRMTSSAEVNSTERWGSTFMSAWTYTTDGASALIASPAVSNGTVVTVSRRGDVVALGAPDGKTRWKRFITGGAAASPAIGDGQIFLPSLEGHLQAIDLATGELRWDRAFGGQNYGSPLLIADPATGKVASVVVPAGFPAQKLARVRASDGVSLWETAPGAIADIVYSSPAEAAGHTIVGMNHGRLQSFDLATGKTDWHYDSGGFVYLSSPLIRDDRAYFFPGDAQSRLFAVDVKTGAPVAGYPVAVSDPASNPAGKLLARNVSTSSPMSLRDLVVVQIRYEYLSAASNGAERWTLREYTVAVDANTASVRWSHLVGTLETSNINQIPELSLLPTPAGYSDGTAGFIVAASSLEAHLSVLSADSGDERWSATLSGATRSSPVLSGGMLYVATDAGVLHAFRSDAAPASMPAGPPPSSEPVASASPPPAPASIPSADQAPLAPPADPPVAAPAAPVVSTPPVVASAPPAAPSTTNENQAPMDPPAATGSPTSLVSTTMVATMDPAASPSVQDEGAAGGCSVASDAGRPGTSSAFFALLAVAVARSLRRRSGGRGR
jgi:MYXO-CTERM domain-containing protein